MLMIIDDFHVVGISFDKAEAEPPLIVDPDTVRASTISPQRLQSVAGRHPQEIKCCGGVQLCELALGSPLECDETPHPIAIGKSFGVLAAKAPNHPLAIYRISIYDTKVVAGDA